MMMELNFVDLVSRIWAALEGIAALSGASITSDG